MPLTPPPQPPSITAEKALKVADAPIADMRQAFARKTPYTDKDRAAARTFIDGKIDMIQRDPALTPAQKAAAIADLKARR